MSKRTTCEVVKLPTPEEFLAQFDNSPWTFDLMVGAALSIKYKYKRLLQDIEKHEKYELIYEGLSDPNIALDVSNKLKERFSDLTDGEIMFLKRITRPGEARLLLWMIRSFERRAIIPGLPKDEAVKFILDMAGRKFQNEVAEKMGPEVA